MQARTETRDWVKARRARTRALIELGGLLAKSELPELVATREADVHAVLMGALLELADSWREPADDPSHRARLTRWRERGRAAFRADAPNETARSVMPSEQGTLE